MTSVPVFLRVQGHDRTKPIFSPCELRPPSGETPSRPQRTPRRISPALRRNPRAPSGPSSVQPYHVLLCKTELELIDHLRAQLGEERSSRERAEARLSALESSCQCPTEACADTCTEQMEARCAELQSRLEESSTEVTVQMEEIAKITAELADVNMRLALKSEQVENATLELEDLKLKLELKV
uniref:Uncharacterized protein n=1 Tax=Noctiluca scintillans TaxID=2966 RepID=A0A7S1F254_NOCSC|mmetsp:Transcript_26105/g.68656  ORF Transcript_26105/g.68656 Transcript_26105/m.68656 type:complete len:183 (+) Transcript_26105:99-647(+)